MKRPIKIALLVIATIVAIVGVAYGILMWRLLDGAKQQETAQEISITPEYIEAMRSAGYPITVTRAYTVSSYGGWHGDGSSMTVFRYLPSESEALIAALKIRSPDYVWADILSEQSILAGSRSQFPNDLLPRSGDSRVVEGKPAEGLPLLEYIVCPSEGLLYTVSNQF